MMGQFDNSRTGIQTRWGSTPWHHEPLAHSQSRPARPDVLVVGGGLTGCSAAYHLARAGVRVAVFEARSIAAGASGRTGGIVLEGTAAGPIEDADACVPGLAELVEREQIACDLHLTGCWEVEHRKGGRVRSLPWSDAGRPIAITAEVSGGAVNPALLTLGIADAAVSAGAQICEQTPVERIGYANQPTVMVGGDEIHPEWIIVCTNAWIGSLMHGITPLSSSLTFACATMPLEPSVIAEIGLEAGLPFYTADLPYLWGRTTSACRIIFGSGLLFGEPDALEKTDVNSQSFDAAVTVLNRRVRGLHPALEHVEFSHNWAGPIAFTENQLPLLGSMPSCPHVLVAGAYSGHGVAMSVRAGELLAGHVVEGHSLPDWGSVLR
jgi:gamma-glutamylputrescine oxidase